MLSEKFDLSETRDAFIGATIGYGGPRILGLSWITRPDRPSAARAGSTVTT